MRLRIPLSRRTTTKMTRARRRSYRWAALALALLTALMVWASAAAASCNFLLKWNGDNPPTDGPFLTPRGIAVDGAGNVYVTDANGPPFVRKFDANGNFLLKFGASGDIPGGFVTPWKVATDSAGNVYVTDTFNGRVSKFNSSGVFQFRFGGVGGGNGQFQNGPGGVAVDSAGNIYVADPDPAHSRIQKFNSAGTFVSALGGPGTGDGQFSGPVGIAIDASDNLYVADTGNNRIQKFNSAGVFQTKWGSSGSGNGQFSAPEGVSVDSSGQVYVADTGNNRIQIFSPTGAFLAACGSAGSADGQFNYPADVATNAAGTAYYVVERDNQRVQKFGPPSATPPTANAGPDQTVECAGATTPVMLDGSASTAGSGTINSYSWSEGSNPLGTGATLSVSLPAGSHTITLTVTDTGGGTDTDDVVVNIADTVAPVIQVNGDNPMTVECHTTFTDPGATATDTCAGSVPVNSSGTVDANTPGTYEIQYTASDGSHTATATRTVNVVDTTPPAISCPADIVVTLPPNSSATSMVVNYPAVTATDGCSSSVSVVSSPPSGSVFPVGTTTVNATADDGNGNTASCSFNVTVQYNFAGFFQPIANPPVFNVVNAGRAIPVKFSLSGNKGLNIFAPGSPSSGPVACNSADEATVLEETVTAGGSSLSYDASSDQYVYVWKTESSWAGTCRQLVVTLKDGSTHHANFRFK